MDDSLKVIESFIDQLNSNCFSQENLVELVDKWNQLKFLCHRINEFASEYNFKGIDAGGHNGCRSMVKIVSKLVPKVQETLQNRLGISSGNQDAWIHATVDVTELLIHLTEEMTRFHESIETTRETVMFLLKWFKESRSKLEKLLKSYWGYYPFFWMDSQTQLSFRFYSLFTTSLSSIPGSLVSLVSREEYVSRQFQLFYEATLYCPVRVISCFYPLVSSLNWLSSKYTGMRTREIKVPRQNHWVIPDDGGKVTFKTAGGDPSLGRDPVKCRVIGHANTRPNGDVILHCQGGGFTIDFPPCYDEIFRSWIPKLGGATIIDICYTRHVRYPIMIQEVLDVYLWLAGKGSELESNLGCIPRKIVLCGDSAGAYLLFTLSAVLRDIQIISSQSMESFPVLEMFPRSLVMVNPVTSLALPTALPSMNIALLDVLLCPAAIFNALGLYSSGIVFSNDCGDMDSNKADYSQKSLGTVFYNTWINSDKNWFYCDSKNFEKVTKKIIENSWTRYKSPTISYDLNLLKDLELSLICGEFDAFLDFNLSFAHSWPGKVTIDVLDDLHHGFTTSNLISKKSRIASQICLRRILEGFEL